MDMGLSGVLAALISAVGLVLATLVQKVRRENRNDHAVVIEELRWLRRLVEKVDAKHDAHIQAFHDSEAKPSSRSRARTNKTGL
jgi:hypothetical protein